MNRADAARTMGKAKSAAKTRAARENGRSGGRPSKELLQLRIDIAALIEDRQVLIEERRERETMLRAELTSIRQYLFDRCEKTCRDEREYNRPDAHAPNCPVCDLGLTKTDFT